LQTEQDFWKQHRRWLDEQPIGEHARKVNTCALKAFFRYIKKRSGWKPPDKKLFAGFLATWSGSDTTLQAYTNSLRRFFYWLKNEELFKDITCNVRDMHRKGKWYRRRPLTREQVAKFLQMMESAKGHSKNDGRDICIFLLMINTGMRCIEICRAKVGHLFEVDGEHFLRVQGKGHLYEDTSLKLPERLYARIQAYLDTRRRLFPRSVNANAWLFVTADGTHRQLCQNRLSQMARYWLNLAGLPAGLYNTHSFRHTAATLALEAGATIEQVQLMLRHSSPTTTMYYVRTVNRMQHPAEDFLNIDVTAPAPPKVLPLKRRERHAS